MQTRRCRIWFCKLQNITAKSIRFIFQHENVFPLSPLQKYYTPPSKIDINQHQDQAPFSWIDMLHSTCYICVKHATVSCMNANLSNLPRYQQGRTRVFCDCVQVFVYSQQQPSPTKTFNSSYQHIPTTQRLTLNTARTLSFRKSILITIWFPTRDLILLFRYKRKMIKQFSWFGSRLGICTELEGNLWKGMT